MIIDFHTHVFPETIAKRTMQLLEKNGNQKASTDATLNGLLDSMTQSKVDLSVILPVVTKPSQFKTINQYACYLNEHYGEQVVSFGGIHPDCNNYKEELREIKNLGLKGIKIHPDYQGVMIDDIRYMNIIDYACGLELAIVTHAGVDVGMPSPVHCPPDKMAYVLDCIKPDKMILAHLGGFQQWDQVEQYIVGKKVYLDTAFIFQSIPHIQAERIITNHGVDKILFATDSPWASQEEGITFLNSLALTKEQREAIFYKNAMDILKSL